MPCHALLTSTPPAVQRRHPCTLASAMNHRTGAECLANAAPEKSATRDSVQKPRTAMSIVSNLNSATSTPVLPTAPPSTRGVLPDPRHPFITPQWSETPPLSPITSPCTPFEPSQSRLSCKSNGKIVQRMMNVPPSREDVVDGIKGPSRGKSGGPSQLPADIFKRNA